MDRAATAAVDASLREPTARLVALCDRGSVRAIACGGVVVATGRVAGQRIACYAHDSAQRAGSVGAVEARAVEQLLERAERGRTPVVGFVASAGARVDEGLPALDGFARIFRRIVGLRGRALQVTVVCGPSAGGGCYAPALGDIVVMTGAAAMFLTGPTVVAAALGERTTAERLGGPRVHAVNGVCDLVAADDVEAAALVRELLTYFAPFPSAAAAAPARGDPGAALPPRAQTGYDVRDVLARVLDAGSLLELAPRWAPNLLTGLARLAGRPIGVLANQPLRLGGVLDVHACEKAVRFISLCDAHELPLAVFVDTPGFMAGARQEEAGIIRRGAELVRTFAAASMPRVTVVLRKAYGGAYIAMNSRALGADAVFAWRGAELGVMGPYGAVELIHGRRLATAADPRTARERLAAAYARDRLGAERALAGGSVDGVIASSETRPALREALRANSRVRN